MHALHNRAPSCHIKYKVAVVGASGYSGMELLRYLLLHPGGTGGRDLAVAGR